ATTSCLIWSGLGLLGVSLAAWQLRRAYLRQSEGDRPRVGRRQRARAPVGDDPMLWKELSLDRADRFGRLVGWAGFLIVLILLSLTGAVLAIICWVRWGRRDLASVNTTTAILRTMVDSSALPLSWLIQWMIGLRAAVAVASEREYGTWDSLLLSSLD